MIIVFLHGEPLDQSRPYPVQQMGISSRARHEHRLLLCVNSSYTPSRYINSFQAVFIGVRFSYRAVIYGRSTEIALDSGWHDESESDHGVFDG